MQRPVFERSVMDGFKSTKAESICMTSLGTRMFAGTNDGTLVLYECRPEQTGRGYACSILDIIRKQTKDKKPISLITVVEQWRTLVGIIDGMIMVYDSSFYQHLSSIPESKGCHLFAVQERSNTLVVASKKKLTVFGWQSPGFMLRREISLVDIPKSICCVGGAAIVGYKKFYECVDLSTGTISRLLDVEKECKMVSLELPATTFRPDSVLLSLGLQGVVLDTGRILAGSSFAFGSAAEERLEWAGQPQSAVLVNPFIVSLLGDAVEVHDLVTLHSLQRIQITSASPHILSLCTGFVETMPAPFAASTGGSLQSFALGGGSGSPLATTSQFVFVCSGEQVSVLKMVSIASQVATLVAAHLFEEAIALCSVCNHPDYVRGVNVAALYEQSASALLTKGDFEKAMGNFIRAGTDFVSVVRQLPELVPLPLHPLLSISIQPGKKMTGQVLQRAASGLVQFCTYHRPKASRRADKAEQLKLSGMGGLIGSGQPRDALELDDEEEEEYIADADEEIRRAQLLDTVLLSALVSCSPSRRGAVVELLSGPNRCQIESCSVLLASQGNSYTEALLWLFRSQNQHNRVLQALTEDKCVGVGAWTREQFYQWTSDYLRWLWYHEEDAALPKQALMALRPVLEYDAELGLSVLISRPANKSSFGGKGVTVAEVLEFLRSVTPKTKNTKNTFGAVGNKNARNSLSQTDGRSSVFGANSGVGGVVASTPLVNGHALGVAFLECLVSSGEAPSSMHDEFAQLLIEGLPLDTELAAVDHSANDLEIRPDDREALVLYKIYRKKLQNFLLNSADYSAKRVLRFLPAPYLHETALVLSRLGKHKEVLSVYVHQLGSLDLAESYCDRIYRSANDAKTRSASTAGKMSFASTGSSFSAGGVQQLALLEAGEIYLSLFKVILETVRHAEDGVPVGDGHGDGAETIHDVMAASDAQLQRSLETVVRLAERYFDRFDPASLLEMLPPSTPVAALLRYLRISMEYSNTRQRNLKIVHQLLRTREVNIRTGGDAGGVGLEAISLQG